MTTLHQRAYLGLLAPLLLIAGCSPSIKTLFQSSFNATAIGSPPSATQATGTAQVFGPSGSVLVQGPPPGASGNWLAITRGAGPAAPIAGFEGDFASHPGDGTYSFLGVLFIPKGTGAATVEFDTSPQWAPPTAQFLHIDFMPNNQVRLDDNDQTLFGSFPNDQSFTLSVRLEVFAVCTVAHVTLLGGKASGSKDYLVPLHALARQIGALKVWMGSPWSGTFDTTDLLVTYQPFKGRTGEITVPPECIQNK